MTLGPKAKGPSGISPSLPDERLRRSKSLRRGDERVVKTLHIAFGFDEYDALSGVGCGKTAGRLVELERLKFRS